MKTRLILSYAIVLLLFIDFLEAHEMPDGLKRPVIKDETFAAAVEMIDAGDVEGLAAYLKEHPDLVNKRLDGNKGYEKGYFANPTLLHFTAYNPFWTHDIKPSANLVEVTEVILDAGAEVDVLCGEASNRGTTLGLVASGALLRENALQVPMIEMLARRGANPNALDAAISHSEWEAVDALVTAGAKSTPILLATQDDPKALKASLEEIDPVSLQKALYAAVAKNKPKNVIILLEAGADPNAFSGFHTHSTVMHQAAWNGSVELLEIMMDRGGRMDIKDKQFNSDPLGWAGHNHQAEAVTFFINRGYEATPQQLAAWGQIEAMEQWVKANPDKVDEVGAWGTCLQQAAYHGRLEVIELLIENGADVNNANGGERVPGKGKTPLDKAIAGNRDEAIALLKKHGGEPYVAK